MGCCFVGIHCTRLSVKRANSCSGITKTHEIMLMARISKRNRCAWEVYGRCACQACDLDNLPCTKTTTCPMYTTEDRNIVYANTREENNDNG